MALTRQFGNTYAGRRVLVTGHTGFKGSWLCLWLGALGARVSGLALAPDTHPSHWMLLNLHEVTDLRVDLHDCGAVIRSLEKVQPEVVFHLAAQPLVRRGYREPRLTFYTNVLGLVNLFEAARSVRSVRALVNVTTDKVYAEPPPDGGYPEDHALGGRDPYSTSKACAELVSECYRGSFFAESRVRIATARAGNVIGGGDWSEDRLVPDLARAASSGQPLAIRNPAAIRPWQHVLEPLSGYLRLGQMLLADSPVEGAWNFGPAGDATMPVGALVSRIQQEWPSLRCELQPGPHPREAQILRLDCSKAAQQLGWRPVWNTDDTIRRTVRWYRAYYERGEVGSAGDLREYVAAASAAGLEWAA